MRKNTSGLRVIRTARSEDEIQAATQEGFWPLVKPVETNPPFEDWFGVYQHPESGEVSVCGNRRYPLQYQGWIEVIPWKTYRLPRFMNPFAAYLIPGDLKAGERVWLEDLIEDFLGVSGSGTARLDASEAVWNGQDFEIDYVQERDCAWSIG